MRIYDFYAEEEDLINTGAGMTLQEFRRKLILNVELTDDDDVKEYVQTVFNKLRLMTEREWNELQNHLPLPGMGLDENDLYDTHDIYPDDDIEN